ncbi:lipase family protein [Cellulomonas sp.]|uniref:lipase family protein n=1 Tax=Cellulomonas sp. TaxID=40001 RepID=UPI001B02895B|nr:lipase family protein [Cellulomonas sp.]MBO9556348.1 DUF308 domain-containing protein [Cellulomonas sp.]
MAGTSETTSALVRLRDARMQWWVRLLVGLALVAVGVLLVLHLTASVAVLSVLVGIGLLLVAADRAVWSFRSSVPGLERVLAALLLVLAVVSLVWQGTTVPFLAVTLAVAAFVVGGTSVVGGLVGTRERRAAAVLLGLAQVVVGLLVLLWPRLSVFLVGLALGAWLVLLGVRDVLVGVAQLLGRRRTRDDDRPRRPRRDLLVAVVALVVASLVLGVSAWLRAGDPRLVPDAFYSPPREVPAEPGSLIRSEPFTHGVRDGQQGWRILYTTTGAHDEPAVASALVLAPAERTGEPLPVLSVAHGTTGIVPGCAPSLLDDPFASGLEHTMSSMVDDGWAGVMTDYEGLGTAGPHPYLVGTAAAYGVLDAVRAARALDGLALSDETVVWGHSQGGGAALWTGIVAPEYAPDVHVLGVGAAAPAADLAALAAGVKNTAAGRVVSSYLAQSWSDVYDLDLSSLVTPGHVPAVRRVADRCLWGRDALANVLFSTQLNGPVIRPSALEGETGRLLAENSPHGRSLAPVLVGQGEADSLVLPGPQDEFVAHWCSTGQAVDYRTYPGLDHVPIVDEGSAFVPELVAWTQDRMSGRPPTPTCGG